MNFDLSEEQSMLKDSLQRLLADNYGFEQRRGHMASAQGWSPDMWSRYTEMGLLALPFAEEDGGLSGTPVETMIVMEEMGRALTLEPWFSTAVLGGSALRLGGSSDQRAQYIPQIADGSLKLALAQAERHSRYDLHHVETRAERSGTGYTLSGRKSIVLDGDSADLLVVSARTAGGIRDEGGIGLFLVDTSAPGVSLRGYRMQDGRRGADISFEGVALSGDVTLGDAEGGLPLLRRVVDVGIAALCAEAVGTMEAMHGLTVDYLKTRKQFGVPIGAFQVLQHKAVDMFVALEQARSITLFATMMADSEDEAERGRAMHAAKAEIGRGGRLCGENAIQLHGGVGMTMEYAIGHHFKRMTSIDLTFGDADHHLQMLAAGGGLFEAA